MKVELGSRWYRVVLGIVATTAVVVVGVMQFLAIPRKQRALYEYLAVTRAYALYVVDNKGELPPTLDDLFRGGYLREVADIDKVAYVAPPERECDIVPPFANVLIYDIEKYHFLYGGRIEDFSTCGAGICRVR